MMAVQHTPGPWAVGAGTGNHIAITAKHWDAPLVGRVPAAGRSAKECEANAHLIAAAPGMLAELRRDLEFAKHVVAFLKVSNETRDVLFTSAQNRVTSLRVTIAKAEGR